MTTTGRKVIDTETPEASFTDLRQRALDARAEYYVAIRTASLVLGRYCRAVEDMTSVASAAARQNPFGMYPEHQTAIAELSRPPVPVIEVDGARPTMGLGWNWKILVLPLQ